jgi:hypothetical protein
MANLSAISNVYDGPRKSVKKPPVRLFSLDFANSTDPAVLDSGIRETMRGINLSAMAVSRALYRLCASGDYIDLGYKSKGAYIDSLVEETGHSRAIFYRWIDNGEIIEKYRTELERIEFADNDGPTKLTYLPKALENHPKKEAFKNLKEMPVRQFESYAKGEKKSAPIVSYKNVSVKGDQVYAGDEPLINSSAELSPEDRRYFKNLLVKAAQAKADNQYLRWYEFYDEREANKFDKVYNREIKILRRKK